MAKFKNSNKPSGRRFGASAGVLRRPESTRIPRSGIRPLLSEASASLFVSVSPAKSGFNGVIPTKHEQDAELVGARVLRLHIGCLARIGGDLIVITTAEVESYAKARIRVTHEPNPIKN